MMSEYAQRQQEWASGCSSHREPIEREKASTQRMLAAARAASVCTCTQQSEWRETAYAADCPVHGYILPDAQVPRESAQSPRQHAIEPQTVYQAVRRLEQPDGLRALLAKYAPLTATSAADFEALDTLLAYVRTVSGLGDA